MNHFKTPVGHYMSAPVEFVRPGDLLAVADKVMRHRKISAVAVLDARNLLVGMISISDLLQHGQLAAGVPQSRATLQLPQVTVSEVMSRKLVSTTVDRPLVEAARLLTDNDVHHVFVANGDKLVGVISTRDIAAAVASAEIDAPVARWMSSPVIAADALATVGDAITQLQQAKTSAIAVTTGSWPVGIFSQREALQWRDGAAETPLMRAVSAAFICADPQIPLHHVARRLAATESRWALVIDKETLVGIVTGLDLARAGVSHATPEHG